MGPHGVLRGLGRRPPVENRLLQCNPPVEVQHEVQETPAGSRVELPSQIPAALALHLVRRHVHVAQEVQQAVGDAQMGQVPTPELRVAALELVEERARVVRVIYEVPEALEHT